MLLKVGVDLIQEKREQILALGRLGWPLRRIEGATGVRRETASGYRRAAGIAVRPPGRWGHPPPNAASMRRPASSSLGVTHLPVPWRRLGAARRPWSASSEETRSDARGVSDAPSAALCRPIPPGSVRSGAFSLGVLVSAREGDVLPGRGERKANRSSVSGSWQIIAIV